MLKHCTHCVEVDVLALVGGAAVQGAVVAGEAVPGPMEVIGHDVDEVQVSEGTAVI